MILLKNYYEVLGVTKNATQEEIKLAYRKLSKKYHPDVNQGNDNAEKMFIEIQEAYKVLKDPESRKAYDERLESPNGFNRTQTEKKQTTKSYENFNIHDFEKNFEQFFGFNPKTKEMTSANKNVKKNPIDTTDLFERFFFKK